jgi:hypothetical protein
MDRCIYIFPRMSEIIDSLLFSLLESAIFESVTMRKASNIETGGSAKQKKQQQQAFLNREANIAGSSTGNGTVEDALSWVEDNIPTSIADQALQALDSEDEIVNTKLERSKMQ